MVTRSTAPSEVDGGIIQVMRVKSGGAHHIAISGTTNRNSSAFPTGSRVIEIYCDTACYWQTGDNTVTASSADHFLPAGHARVYSLGGDKQTQHTHIAVIQALASGTLHVSELE